MSVIVTDEGFGADDGENAVLDVTPGEPLSTLPLDGVALVRVAFGAFADGRGFTVARSLRLMGYRGRLRAVGPLVADQYAMARRSGFDEVEIPDEIAARQPEAQWLFRADWRAHDYQSRLRGAGRPLREPVRKAPT